MIILPYKHPQNLTSSHTTMTTVSLVPATLISHLDYCDSSQMVFLFLSLSSPLLRNTLWFPIPLRINYKAHIMNIRLYMI